MPVQINTDLITIVSTLFGVIGVSLAIFQTVTARRAKQIYEGHCKGKCKDIVGLSRSMAEEVVDACNLVRSELKNLNSNDYAFKETTTLLAAKINGIRLLTVRLASFCENLNDEYSDQFGEKVYPDLDKELPQTKCLIEDLALQEQVKSATSPKV